MSKNNEHEVWNILNKEKYTDKGIEKVENIYNFIMAMQKTIGPLALIELYNCWNVNSDETF